MRAALLMCASFVLVMSLVVPLPGADDLPQGLWAIHQNTGQTVSFQPTRCLIDLGLLPVPGPDACDAPSA